MSDTEEDYYFDYGEAGYEKDQPEFAEYQPDYVTSYKEDVAAMTGGPTDKIKNMSKTAQKILKSGKEDAFEQCRGILSSNVYSNVSTKVKDRVLSRLGKMNNLSLFRLEFIVTASIFVETELDDKQFSKFVKKYSSERTSEIDIFRYVRYLREGEPTTQKKGRAGTVEVVK